MEVKIVSPPTTEPVSYDEAKKQLRLDLDDEQTLVESYITAAREYCEGVSNETYMTTTKLLLLDEISFPVKIPGPPIQSVEKIELQKSDGSLEEWDATNYIVDAYGKFGYIRLAEDGSLPDDLSETNTYQITYIAGRESADKVPAKYKNAIKLLVTHWYENRIPVAVGTTSTEIQFAVTALLGQDRVVPT